MEFVGTSGPEFVKAWCRSSTLNHVLLEFVKRSLNKKTNGILRTDSFFVFFCRTRNFQTWFFCVKNQACAGKKATEIGKMAGREPAPGLKVFCRFLFCFPNNKSDETLFFVLKCRFLNQELHLFETFFRLEAMVSELPGAAGEAWKKMTEAAKVRSQFGLAFL